MMAESTGSPSGSNQTSSSAHAASPTIDTENPFIAFRRFADTQISSLLQSVIGLPSLFAEPIAGEQWSSIDDFRAKRREARIQARQQWIAETERDLHAALGGDSATPRRREEEMQKWGAFQKSAKVDQPTEVQKRNREDTRRRHESMGWDGKQRTEANSWPDKEGKKDREERFTVSTSEGEVNLKRVVDSRDEGQGFWMAKDDPRLRSNTITGQDPFSDPDQAVSWLLTDGYSPLYLDRSLPYRLHPSFYKSDAGDSYFRGDYQPGDLYPRFASNSVTRHDPRLAGKVDWRAAFHDLLDIHHKGSCSSPTHITNRVGSFSSAYSPGSWISYLIGTGSLGSQWRRLSAPESILHPYRFCYGNSPEAWAVLPFQGRLYVRDMMGKSRLAPFGEYEPKNDALAVISEADNCTTGEAVLRDPLMNDSIFASKNAGQREESYNMNAQKQMKMLGETMDDSDWRSYRPAFTKAAISLIRNPDTEQSTLRAVDRVLRMIENSELEDEVESILAKTFSGIDFRSQKIFKEWFNEADDLLRNDYFEAWKAAKESVDSEHPDVYGVKTAEPEKKPSKLPSVQSSTSSSPPVSKSLCDSKFSPSFSSSSSSSHNYESTGNQSPTSIVSTLSTIETRTLPDGRTQIRRVLKKRFADGREESSESTQIQSGRPSCDVGRKSVPKKPEAEVTGKSEPSVVPTREKKWLRGWFWTR
ncbi:hypothetical protein GJ744_001099 [Endocarpon pusillum]|uniref:Uncharacterized protein n=1 Tax=Endocarpon pusillum TaxID=364733 RepID=A0A8H7ADS0_9EURO|nr:hypothetical protein GJ744_001099 [Endocarpon pusillum]